MPIYKIGTSGWNYADWRNIFYPKNVPQSQWLSFYANYFQTVEINATFYRSFDKKIYKKWHDAVPEPFEFILKVPRYITHWKKLQDCDKAIKLFCQSAKLLKNKLGLLLMQFPASFPYDPEKLEKALLAFGDLREKVVVEFRNKIWLTEEVHALLVRLNCIFCVIDSPLKINCNWVTSNIAYFRMHGRKIWYNYSYSTHELQQIQKRAQLLAKKGAKQIYIFFNNDVDAFAIESASYLQKRLKPKVLK